MCFSHGNVSAISFCVGTLLNPRWKMAAVTIKSMKKRICATRPQTMMVCPVLIAGAEWPSILPAPKAQNSEYYDIREGCMMRITIPIA